MKKQFNSPVCEVVAVSVNDVIACSSCSDYEPSAVMTYTGNPIVLPSYDPLDPNAE